MTTPTLQQWDSAFCAAENNHPAQLAALVGGHNVPPEFRERHQRLISRLVQLPGRPKQRDADGFTRHNKNIADAVQHCRRLKLGKQEHEAVSETLPLFGLTENVLRIALDGKNAEVRKILQTRKNIPSGFRAAM